MELIVLFIILLLFYHFVLSFIPHSFKKEYLNYKLSYEMKAEETFFFFPSPPPPFLVYTATMDSLSLEEMKNSKSFHSLKSVLTKY